MNCDFTQKRDFIFVTANARYSHTSLAIRSLVANLKEYANRAKILEFTINDGPQHIAESILNAKPKVVLFSVYLWNTTLLTEVAAIIKQVEKKIPIVVGGPEVSFEVESQNITTIADVVITGEAETTLPTSLDAIINGELEGKPYVIKGEIPDLQEINLPYHLYDDSDIANRVIYVEASRGCPFGCEFCLSSLDRKIRRFPPKALLDSIETLWHRGARRFKFLDRALHIAIWPELLSYFESKQDPELFLHFELVPDRLPGALLEGLKRFPKGAVQLEAGIQTLNDEVSLRIGRKQNIDKAFENLKALHEQTGVHIHSDLVIGLPGETLSSFAEGFDRLMSLELQEIQVGILKRLRGAPIRRHDREWGMVYNGQPPYDILQNHHIDFATMQRLKRFAKYFDLICNRGHFNVTKTLIWGEGSPFEALLSLSDWLFKKTGRTHSIAMSRMAELLFTYCTSTLGIAPETTADSLYADLIRLGRRGIPKVIAEKISEDARLKHPGPSHHPLPRQRRHL